MIRQLNGVLPNLCFDFFLRHLVQGGKWTVKRDEYKTIFVLD
jgi:hypothetical protein